MNHEETVGTSIRMPKELRDAIQRIADLAHRSFSKQVVFFLANELGQTNTQGGGE